MMNSLLETRRITKSFAGIRVLADVSFELLEGEIHAVMGENGAGKSTLMKLLAGIYQPDSGEILLQGRLVHLQNAHRALKLGIAMVYQEPMPFLDLAIAENVFMGQEPVRRFPGWIDKKRMLAETTGILARLGVHLDPRRRMRELRVAEMQTAEIAKALAHNARIIILDEPTSALSEHETEALFRIIGDLKSRGVTMVYISHKLEEVFRLADQVTVLRDGRLVARHAIKEVDRNTLISEMVGRTFREPAPNPPTHRGAKALTVNGLGKRGRFSNVSFEVRCGEVLGLAGLMGAGRTDVINAIYGLEPADSGEICVHGRPVRIPHPRHALKAGIGLVSEDRKLFGFVPALGARANMTLAALRKYCRSGWILRRAECRVAQEQIQAFSIRGADRDQPVARLSGGNQQKVVLARMLLTGPDILLLDEPTRGVDIAAKTDVHELIRRLVSEGKAVVLASSELPELLALSDRVLVMREGKPVAELDARATTPEEILKLAMPQ